MLDGVAAAAGPGPDRRRHRRAHHRQGDRAGRREAADRGQSSRGACADRAADRRHGVSLLPVPRLRRAHADRRGARRRQVCAARHHARRRDRRSLRQDRQAARARLSGRAGGRARGEERRCAALHPAAPDARPPGGGLLALGAEDRAARRGREGRAVERSGRRRSVRLVPAGGGRRRDGPPARGPAAVPRAVRRADRARGRGRRRGEPVDPPRAQSRRAASTAPCWSRRRPSFAPTTAR